MNKLHEPLRFTIPLDPKPKKNNMQPRIGRGGKFLGMMQSDIYLQYEADCLRCIPRAARLGIDYPVNIKTIYYRQTKRRVDITNLHSALHDILTKAGVIIDDNCSIVVSTDGSRVRFDKHNPRTEVIITESEDEDYQTNLFNEMVEDW